MIQLVYASAATTPFSPAALRSLLTKARARNTAYEVSGMLLYHNGSFMQVLEGPERGVELIMHSIRKDARHCDTKVLRQGEVPQREFADWSMGFIDTSSSGVSQAAGQIDYERVLPQLIDAPTAARRYLRFFEQGLCRQGAAAF